MCIYMEKGQKGEGECRGIITYLPISQKWRVGRRGRKKEGVCDGERVLCVVWRGACGRVNIVVMCLRRREGGVD